MIVKRNKNILIVFYNLSNLAGDAKMTCLLANELAKDKLLKIFLLSFGSRWENIPYFIDNRINYFTFKKTNNRLFINALLSIRNIINLIQNNNIEIVIFSSTNSTILVPFIKFYFGNKIKIIIWDHSGLSNNKCDFKSPIVKFLGAKLCNKQVVLTPQIKDDFIRKLKIRGNKIALIPNWVEKNNNLRNYDINSKKLISIGRIAPEKGYDLLLKVAQKLIEKKYTDWQWDIYGNGPDFYKIKDEISKLGLDKYVLLKGEQPFEKIDIQQYSIYVLTSYREAFPLTILEAKYHLLPVVSFDINSGPSYLIKDSLNGYLVKPFDIDEMVERIIELMSNNILRSNFSLHSQDDTGKFDKQKIINQWKEII